MTPRCREQRQRRHRGAAANKAGSGLPAPPRRPRDVPRAGQGCQGQAGHSRAETAPNARSRNESFGIASEGAPAEERSEQSPAPRISPRWCIWGAASEMWASPARCMDRGKGAATPRYLFIYLLEAMYGWHPEGIWALKKKKKIKPPLDPNEKKNETAALTPTLKGRWAERKKTQKSHASTKPVDYCRSFFASLRTNILLTAMQHKGIMLIVFLEYLISGHGEAGKKNKSILPFWNNLS